MSVLVDTSAWVEFLRGTDSITCTAVESSLRSGTPLMTCDPVLMEVLAGARSEHHLGQLRRLLARTRHVHATPADYEVAAMIYRGGRRKGVTIRRLVDCLIAAVALREGVPVLHHDADFDSIALVTDLVVRRD